MNYQSNGHNATQTRLKKVSEWYDKIAQSQYLPPQAIEIEQSILGAMMQSQNAVHEVIEIIGANRDIFYRDAHGDIYESILSLHTDSITADLLTTTERMRLHGTLEGVGGTPYLVDLTQKVVTTANCTAHARLLVEKYLLRRAIEICEYGKLSAFTQENDTFDILETIEREIFHLSEVRLTKTAELPVGEVLQIAAERERVISGEAKTLGLPSGLKDLDEITRGFGKSELIIIAGRSGQGKTALGIEIAANLAEQDIPVGFVSIEMSKKQLLVRMICRKGNFSSSNYYTNFVNKETADNAAKHVAKYKIPINDSPSMTPLQLRAEARRMKAKHGIQLLIVDYLQIMSSSKDYAVREQEVAQFSRSLKQVARELDIPVIALSQLNRQVEARVDKCPVLSDLRESGQIEQDADKVVFIWRPEYYGDKTTPNGRDSTNVACLSVAKHRDGATKKNIEVFFNLQTQKMGDLTPYANT